MTIINGKEKAKNITDKISNYTKKLNIIPNLAVILIGDNKASQLYVQAKINKAEECGFSIALHKFDHNIDQASIVNLILELNADPNINGILVQLPLPKHLDVNLICQTIDPVKDVDGFTYVNTGKLIIETNKDYHKNSSLLPCTPLGIFVLLTQIHGYDFSGLDAVIVGRSNLVGKPIANLLLSYNATITVAHSHTKDLAEVTRSADILIVASGQAHLIKKDFIKEGATIIDVGINYDNKGNIIGDVNFDECKDSAGYITPVPGGVGPMTIAMLIYNTLKAYSIQKEIDILKII